MHPSLRHKRHRPWPLPAGQWAWRQNWSNLLFAHWPVACERLEPLVPPGLRIEEFDGTAWIGVVPFRMSGVARWPIPAVPGFSAFPELNLRTYVECGGKPGVWFFSLDAANALAVWSARKIYRLPYYHSRMSIESESGGVHYRSERKGKVPVKFEARYEPVSDARCPVPGSLDHWLTERYCLYSAAPDGGLRRMEIHHAPWELQSVEVQLERNELAGPLGIPLEGPPVHACFSKKIEAVVWPAERVSIRERS